MKNRILFVMLFLAVASLTLQGALTNSMVQPVAAGPTYDGSDYHLMDPGGGNVDSKSQVILGTTFVYQIERWVLVDVDETDPNFDYYAIYVETRQDPTNNPAVANRELKCYHTMWGWGTNGDNYESEVGITPAATFYIGYVELSIGASGPFAKYGVSMPQDNIQTSSSQVDGKRRVTFDCGLTPLGFALGYSVFEGDGNFASGVKYIIRDSNGAGDNGKFQYSTSIWVTYPPYGPTWQIDWSSGEVTLLDQH